MLLPYRQYMYSAAILKIPLKCFLTGSWSYEEKISVFYLNCDIIRTNARFLTSAKISFQVQSKYIPSLLDFRSKHRRNFPPFLGIIWGAAYLTPQPRRLAYVDFQPPAAFKAAGTRYIVSAFVGRSFGIANLEIM